jgi:integrase/recombinase XerD
MVRPASRVSKVLMTGPLAPFAGAYALELKQRCYTPLTSVVQLRQAARLSNWLEVRGLSVADLTGERVEEFLAFQRATGRWRAQWSRPGLLCLLDVLQRLGVLATEEPVQAGSSTDALLASFERYLLSERGVAAGTARGYVRHAARFLAAFSPCGLADVTAADVTQAVLRESAAVSVSATQYFVAGLRALLYFCFVEGLMHVDLSQAALPVTGRRRSSLPRGITPAEARALLESCDRRSVLGRRDYAIIITLCGWACAEARWPVSASMTSIGGQASWSWWARALGGIVCRCPSMLVRRSPPICGGGARPAIGGRCSCGPGRRSIRSRLARSPRPCVGRAGEQG